MTNKQIGMIKGFQKKAGVEEAGYRLMLKNIGGVKSSRDLDQKGFEDMMAALEDLHGDGTFWREKVATRNRAGGSGAARMIALIKALFAEYGEKATQAGTPEAEQYKLAGLVTRATSNRTRDVDRLYPWEAWRMIETMKVIVKRTEADAAKATGESSSIFSPQQGHSREAAAPLPAATPADASSVGGGNRAPALPGKPENPFNPREGNP